MPLSQMRNDAADKCFQEHDFGNAIVEDADGWEHVQPGDEWTRTIYVQPDTPGEPTRKGHFTVRFEKDGYAIREAFGILDGNILGQPQPSHSI